MIQDVLFTSNNFDAEKELDRVISKITSVGTVDYKNQIKLLYG